ncbi:cyclic nucleotide-binding protein [Desulfitobacterium hafniense DCB-2]|uniref:Crp/Fnr family transcriptional regulator n=2 Tax=Desulfitobacterium hafniense TaxID=49338 RepID=Q8RPH4_DESHA|nr:Crp/Fnr family transcriptional regulator [Desulfitobacterium hafniense]AAL87778.1 unknown [Desulfitobacterium hafniense DCB-2]ACL18764.1 cyclic nucleotide-binding protein [Desulfitobacterium hafniense DCB-2]
MLISNSQMDLQWIERPVRDIVVRHTLSKGTKVRFKKRTVIIEEGSIVQHAYVIFKGWAAYYLSNPCGQARIASLVGPLRSFGLGPALDQLPVKVSIVAVEDCEMYRVSRSDLIQAMQEDVNFGIEMVSVVNMRVRSILEGANIFSSLSTPEQRLIYYFISLLQSEGVKEDGEWYALPVNLCHEQIGEIIDTSRITVCRMFNRFKQTEKLKMEHNRIYIHKKFVENYLRTELLSSFLL